MFVQSIDSKLISNRIDIRTYIPRFIGHSSVPKRCLTIIHIKHRISFSFSIQVIYWDEHVYLSSRMFRWDIKMIVRMKMSAGNAVSTLVMEMTSLSIDHKIMLVCSPVLSINFEKCFIGPSPEQKREIQQKDESMTQRKEMVKGELR